MNGTPVRKPATRKPLSAGIAIATLALLAGAGAILDVVLYPWAHSLTGSNTLTGEWLGEMAPTPAHRYWVWMTLTHSIATSSCANCPTIEGTVRTCEANGSVRSYEAWGHAENRAGTMFLLKTRAPEERGKLTLLALNGVWSAGKIEFTTDLVEPGASSDANTPARWEMQRGSEKEFERRCEARR
jgi:hypothetical protein